MNLLGIDLTSLLLFLLVLDVAFLFVLGLLNRYVIPRDLPIYKLSDSLIFWLFSVGILIVFVWIVATAWVKIIGV